MSTKQYTDAQKAAYYKAKAAGKGSKPKAAVSRPRVVIKKPQAASRPVVKSFFPKGSARMAGSTLGSYFGPVGSALGGAAGDLFSRITGIGDYKVNANSLMGKQTPMMHQTKSGFRICNREYLQDISGSVGFSTQANIDINPGQVSFSPWLAQIAQQFQFYKIHGLVFDFISTSAESLVNGTNTQLGVVILATQYNSINGPFTNKQQMENSQYATSSKPSSNCIHPIECDPRQVSITELYVRPGAVPANADQRLYDLGQFTIATSGMPAANVIGELHISYDIEFMMPIQTALIANSADLIAKYKMTAPTTTNYFGTAQSQVFDNIGITFNSPSTIISFPVGALGKYMITWFAYGASTAALVGPTVVYANATALNYFVSSGQSFRTTGGTTTDTAVFYIGWFNITSANSQCTITFSGGTLCGTPSTGDLIIQPVNGGVNA